MRLRSFSVSIMLVLAVLCGAMEAQKVKVEFDKSVDFSAFKTFAWDPAAQPTSRPMLVAAIKAAINEELSKRGLTPVEGDPDMYVQAYGGTESDAAISYSDLYYGPGGITPFDQSFLMYGAIPGSTTTVIVHKGELIVDLLDAHRKKLVWRAKANEKLSEKRSKALDQVNTAVEKMFAQYPPKKQ
jgi:hypothetical protein